MEASSEQLSMSCVVLRVGQLCGHSKYGCWSKEDMYPIMFATSVNLKAVPIFTERQVDWLPVDFAAETIKDVLTRDKRAGGTAIFYQVVHPRPASWSNLVHMLQDSQIQETGERLEEIAMPTWVERLRTRSDTGHEVVGLKLISFFEQMALQEDVKRIFLTEKSCLMSPALSNCPSLAPSWLPR